MIELHLIGYTADLGHLVLDLAGADGGRYRLIVDADLFATIDELREERRAAGLPVGDLVEFAEDLGIDPEQLVRLQAEDEAAAAAAGQVSAGAAAAADWEPRAEEHEVPQSAVEADAEPEPEPPPEPEREPEPEPAPEAGPQPESEPEPVLAALDEPAADPEPEVEVEAYGQKAAEDDDEPIGIIAAMLEAQEAARVSDTPRWSDPPPQPAPAPRPQPAPPPEPTTRPAPTAPRRTTPAHVDPSVNGRAPVDARLSPAEIQARLRAGRSVRAVATEAGTDVAWIERWLQPIVAERARILGEAQTATLERPRLGRSRDPLGDAVRRNLAARGVPADEVVWEAARRRDGRWKVAVRFPHRGRRRSATWTYDPEERELSPASEAARDLGFTRRRR